MPSSSYAREVRRDETRLRTWLVAHRHGPKKPALVLDVDDTALLTYNYEISEDFGFNPTTNAEFVLAQRFPAVFGMVDTVSWATQHGFTLFFITGRPDTQQDATEGNLAKVGYPTPKQVFTRDRTEPIPAYLTCQATCTTVQYKSLTRKHIESLGYRIVADVGDQFSDLQGDHEQRAFKLPNHVLHPVGPDGPGPACPNAAPPGRARESGDRVERAHDDARATAFPRRPRR